MMKHLSYKFYFFLLIFSTTIVFNCYSQTSLFKKSEVSYLENNDKAIILLSSGYSDKKKEVVVIAEKNAFETILFVGIPGFNDNKSIIEDPDKMKDVYSDYFVRLFEEGRYRMFILNSAIYQAPNKSGKGEFKATVKITINLYALIKDLELNGIIRGFGLGEEVENTIQPTIMIVPYKEEGKTYKYIIQNDFDKRVAIAKVQDGFDKRGFNTIDFEAKLNATLKTANFEMNSQSSMDKQLIQNSGADIYVTVDINKDFSSSGNQVSLILKGYETASAKALASKQGWSGKFRTNQVNRLCEIAVEIILDDFLDMLNSKFGKTTEEGSTIVLNISLSPESEIDLDSEVGKDNIPFSDALRMWVKKNAFNNYYHLQGTVSNAMIFDDIRIPLTDVNGNSYNQNDFAFDIWSYIKNTLNINCKKVIDGQTIYITIQ